MASNDVDDLIILVGEVRSALAAINARLDNQETVLGNLGEQVELQAELLGTKDPAFLLSPWWWPTMTSAQAEEAWKTLTEWVDGLIIPRYDDGKSQWALGELPASTRVLRCWFAHPGIVDKLSALFWAQKGDYRRNAAANGPLEWQENWLPKTLDGLDAEFRTKACIGGCPHLNGRIAGEWPDTKHKSLTLRDRMQWIRTDVERRPE